MYGKKKCRSDTSTVWIGPNPGGYKALERVQKAGDPPLKVLEALKTDRLSNFIEAAGR
ncbi:MAG: hypothetical protein CM1200mP24_09940 [Gammaproteobacteria bacterium]|nr:MAG: hypothetical protein CM1200mP24_09940 [Gammaproteobacteria bacterium]